MNSNLEVFVDGDCPLCSREVAWLRRLDVGHQLKFTDISDAGFDASSVGPSYSQLMRRIHARLPSGELIEGVEVFRQVYALLGFDRLVSVSRWPLLRQALDLGYTAFALSRLRLTGRCEVPARPRAPNASLHSAEADHG